MSQLWVQGEEPGWEAGPSTTSRSISLLSQAQASSLRPRAVLMTPQLPPGARSSSGKGSKGTFQEPRPRGASWMAQSDFRLILGLVLLGGYLHSGCRNCGPLRDNNISSLNEMPLSVCLVCPGRLGWWWGILVALDQVYGTNKQ